VNPVPVQEPKQPFENGVDGAVSAALLPPSLGDAVVVAPKPNIRKSTGRDVVENVSGGELEADGLGPGDVTGGALVGVPTWREKPCAPSVTDDDPDTDGGAGVGVGTVDRLDCFDAMTTLSYRMSTTSTGLGMPREMGLPSSVRHHSSSSRQRPDADRGLCGSCPAASAVRASYRRMNL
jgi:hypothetical protein